MSDTSPPAPPPAPPPGPLESSASSRSLPARVFDLSFSEFVTPSLIKLLFVLGIVFAGLFALAIFVSLASQGGGAVVLGLLLAPLVFIVYVLLARVVCEIYIILFRIEENTRKS